MKKSIAVYIISTILLNMFLAKSYSQSIDDSMMIARSEKWNIEYKKGIVTLSQPGSTQTFTMNLTKLDSGKIKQKRKDSSYIGFSSSGEGTNWDQQKYMTINKTKLYRLQSGNDENATQSLFAISSEIKETRQTLFGRMISKSNENNNEVLSDKRLLSGTITRNNTSDKWDFTVDNFDDPFSKQGLPFISPIPLTGFLKDGKDSLFFHPTTLNADVELSGNNGDPMAALKFRKKPMILWVRKDIDNPLQDAIGVLFGIIISAKKL